MNERVQIIKEIPPDFLNVRPNEITQIINRPTLLHLPGEKDAPLFISILLHGNEFSGLTIIQEILKKYHNQILPRDLIIFIGNPQACALGVRHLAGQRDCNRIWRGGDSHEHLMAKAVLQYVKEQNIYAAIDIHNNSGRNPIYGCINRKSEDFVKLAQSFSSDIVYFIRPDSVLSLALAQVCPTTTIECGLPGDPQGIISGVKLIQTILSQDEKWREDQLQIDYVYYTYATLYIAPDSTISFQNPSSGNHHFCLINQFDELNFQELDPGFVLGQINDPERIKLIDQQGINIFEQTFSIIDDDWVVKSPFIPSMFTKNIDIAKSDCLGYVMAQIPIDRFHD